MSKPMSHEPDNGPEMAIPDSDTYHNTYIPADEEFLKNFPDCEGTVVCKLVGWTKKCKCRKSITALELLQESPIPEGTVVCILVGKIVILVHKWQFRHKGGNHKYICANLALLTYFQICMG